MPPEPAESAESEYSDEQRLDLAIEAYNKPRPDGRPQFKSIRAADSTYNVDHTTLTRRLRGTTKSRKVAQQIYKKLSPAEEKALIRWILDLEERGHPPAPSFVTTMADLLLSKRCGSIKSVGKNWTTKFIKRSPELKTKFYRRYDYARAKCEDPDIIYQWFNLYQNMLGKYGFPPSDIWNFDETGFAMGIHQPKRVVCSANTKKPTSIQAGNREWVTTIEAINADGDAAPPLFIFKGKLLQTSWFDEMHFQPGWNIEVSDNGWTNDQLPLRWLTNVFHPYSDKIRVSNNRALIMDGHGSHHSAAFDTACRDFNIIPIYLPPHSSHLLQPLDVGIFSTLKSEYGSELDTRSRLGINHVDKCEFLSVYKQTRPTAFTRSKIKSAFRSTGIHPINPEPVIQRLKLKIPPPRSPTTDDTSQPGSSPFQPKTPCNLREAHKQVARLNARLNDCSNDSTINPDVLELINQSNRGLKQMASQLAILQRTNDELVKANNRQTAKRALGRSYISNKASSDQDGSERLNTDPADLTLIDKPTTRAARKCSLCNREGHTSRTCHKHPI